MKILMISYHTCPLASEEGKETGGMNVYVLELAKALGRQGHQVDLVTRSQGPENPYCVNVSPGVTLYHLPAGPQAVLSKASMVGHIPAFVEAVKHFISSEKKNYDVIHAHYYMSGLIALELKKSLSPNLPLVMTFHTLALMKNLVGRTASEKEDFFRIEAELKLVEEAQAIISPTVTEKEYLQYLYDARTDHIAVISPGVNTDHFVPQDRKIAKEMVGADLDHHILLFVGRIEPLKGIDVLLYALKIITKRQPHLKVCLWIVGGDVSQPISEWSDELKRLEQLRRELGLETAVVFEGQQPQERLPLYYSAADLLVMPSHYEAFGMVALEAMACGTPFITTNVTGVSTLINEEHEEIVTTVNNPLQLASQITAVITDDEAYEILQESLRKKALKLSWHNIAQQIAEVYGRQLQK